MTSPKGTIKHKGPTILKACIKSPQKKKQCIAVSYRDSLILYVIPPPFREDRPGEPGQEGEEPGGRGGDEAAGRSSSSERVGETGETC